jgi:hypothetical protein
MNLDQLLLILQTLFTFVHFNEGANRTELFPSVSVPWHFCSRYSSFYALLELTLVPVNALECDNKVVCVFIKTQHEIGRVNESLLDSRKNTTQRQRIFHNILSDFVTDTLIRRTESFRRRPEQKKPKHFRHGSSGRPRKRCRSLVSPVEKEFNGTAALKIVSYCLNINIYSYIETSGGQSSSLYFNVVHFFNTTDK